MRKLFLLIIAGLMVLLFCSCGQKQTAESDDSEPETLTIGFSLGTFNEDRWIRDRDILISKAKQEGFDVIVTNANNDSDQQYEQVEKLIGQGIDVLLIVPNHSRDAVRCVDIARQNGIPVVAYDRLIYNADVDAYVTFDNYQVGALMAQTLLEKVPKGNYIIINGDPNDNNCTEVRKGIYDVLDGPIDNGDIEVLEETSVPGWVRETAYDFMVGAIKKYGAGIDAVVVGNDSLAWGVIDALSEAQITGVQISGQDADLTACRRIVQGQQAVTIYKPTKDLVEAAMEICIQLVEDGAVTTVQATVEDDEMVMTTETVFDGKYDVPYIAIDVVAVTAQNMDDTVIKDNFHLKEEVYKSVE